MLERSEQLLESFAEALMAGWPAFEAMEIVDPTVRRLNREQRANRAAELEQHPYVREYCRRAGERLRAQREVRQRKLLDRLERREVLASIVRTDVTDLVGAGGKLKDEKDLKKEQKAAIKKVKTRSYRDAGGDGDVVETEIELHDKLAALKADAELAGEVKSGSGPGGGGVVLNILWEGETPKPLSARIVKEKSVTPALDVETAKEEEKETP